MKLYKKYVLAILSALVIQALFGVNLASAVPCEAEMLKSIEIQKNHAIRSNYTFTEALVNYNFAYTIRFANSNEFWPNLKARLDSFGTDDVYSIEHFKNLNATAKENLQQIVANEPRNDWGLWQVKLEVCYTQAMVDANADINSIINGKTAKSFSESHKNQTSSSGSSSSQSNSPESYNLQVSQANKQNYQAMQQAYDKATQGKGKKNNKAANAVECMKTNPAQKSFTNKCDQPINFTYCFSGVPRGAKNENPETLSDLSCQNGQFGTLAIGAGESIPGSYNGLLIEGLPCKSPSQPVDMAFDRATNAATGRCSF